MKIIVLSALGNDIAGRCVDSLLKTVKAADFDIYLVRERVFRERTLNFALSLVGTDDDILFVGDDIEFTSGWYEALMANYMRADSLGMSMLYPGTKIVQDRGYDLIQIDDRITLEAKDRGLPQSELAPFGSRLCDGLCGCFMLVKADVFRLVSSFSEEGQNRWGEFIFMVQARQHGFKIAVIDHYLYHSGQSTKSNANKQLSSISYMVERDIWDKIVTRYVDRDRVRLRYRRRLTPELRRMLETGSKRLLIYGIGTVTEFVLSQVSLDKSRVSFCSGLPEESGRDYYGHKVQAIKEVDFKKYDAILITPLYIGEELYRDVLNPLLPRGYDSPVFGIEETKSENYIDYRLHEIYRRGIKDTT